MVCNVVIAGAGPVGLFLACELALAQLSVLVLEQAQDPHSPLKRLPFGMRGLSAPTIEAFYRRGLLTDIVAPQPPRRQAGHFAGIPFDYHNIDTSKWPYRLPSPADTNMAADMEHIESALAVRAGGAAPCLRRRCHLDSLSDCHHLDGSRLPGDGLPQRAGAARR